MGSKPEVAALRRDVCFAPINGRVSLAGHVRFATLSARTGPSAIGAFDPVLGSAQFRSAFENAILPWTSMT